MAAPASPAEVLEALHAHLDPSPLVQLLPTALQLFSHVMLLSAAVGREAQSALELYEAGRGALRAADVRLLNSCAGKEWGVMYRLSLDMRRAVSTAKLERRESELDAGSASAERKPSVC